MKRKRAKQVITRMTDDEYLQFQRKVSESGISQQQFVISSVLDKDIINPSAISKLIPELSHIGTNLNQIARRCNSGHADILLEVSKIHEEVSKIWQSLSQLVRGRE